MKPICFSNRDNQETYSLNQPIGEEWRYIPDMSLVEIVHSIWQERLCFFSIVCKMSQL